MKKLLPLLVFTVAGAFALPASIQAEDAKPGGPGGRGNPGERLKMMAEKLDLTAEQKEKVKAIMEKNAPQMKELMAKGRENLSEEDKTKLREMMKGQMEEIAAVLTPEQKEKWKAEREAGGRGRPGGKPGEGKPGDKK